MRQTIAALLEAYRVDESYWFERVPDLLRALSLGQRERVWLARQAGAMPPARGRTHEEMPERLAADLERGI